MKKLTNSVFTVFLLATVYLFLLTLLNIHFRLTTLPTTNISYCQTGPGSFLNLIILGITIIGTTVSIFILLTFAASKLLRHKIRLPRQFITKVALYIMVSVAISCIYISTSEYSSPQYTEKAFQNIKDLYNQGNYITLQDVLKQLGTPLATNIYNDNIELIYTFATPYAPLGMIKRVIYINQERNYIVNILNVNEP